MEAFIITLLVVIGLLLAVPIYKLANGKSMSESFSVFTGMFQKNPSTNIGATSPTPTKIPSWFGNFFKKVSGVAGFLIAIALVICTCVFTWNFSVEKSKDLFGDNEENVLVTTKGNFVKKTLTFRPESEAQFEDIAPYRQTIDIDVMPYDGIIVNSYGEPYKVGPSYGYIIPKGGGNLRWKCISLSGNTFQSAIYLSSQ